MAATKRVFISDVHIGVRGSKEWFQDKHKANLIDTLEEIAGKPDQIKDLVLLGDFFENWMAPVNKPPPTIDDIVKNQSNQDIFKALEKCTSSTINVYYLNGNHDMHINQKDLNKLPIKGKIQFITHYHAGLLYGEHGSRFAMFNARDKMHDPFDG
jgi:UDP-2,3-diacylglucosamine pyrophosphatase LpxH